MLSLNELADRTCAKQRMVTSSAMHIGLLPCSPGSKNNLRVLASARQSSAA